MLAFLAGSNRLRWSSSVNFPGVGNSLVYGVVQQAANQDLMSQLGAVAPVAGSGATVQNLGTSGYTWDDLASNASTIDAAWVSGKTNVMLLWEDTNTICNQGLSATVCATKRAAYIAARRAVHPWIIVLLTTLPREAGSIITDQTTRNAANASLVAVNATASSAGADAVVDVRQAGSPFAFTGYTTADFNAASAYFPESAGSRIHLGDVGRSVVRDFVAPVLKRLPKRAH